MKPQVDPLQLPRRMDASFWSDRIMWASFHWTVCSYCQIRFRLQPVINESLIDIYWLIWVWIFHWLLHQLIHEADIFSLIKNCTWFSQPLMIFVDLFFFRHFVMLYTGIIN